jgi:hypothetical protein
MPAGCAEWKNDEGKSSGFVSLTKVFQFFSSLCRMVYFQILISGLVNGSTNPFIFGSIILLLFYLIRYFMVITIIAEFKP